jgi:hypothetical protein
MADETKEPQITTQDLSKLKETMFAGMTKLNDKIEALRSNLVAPKPGEGGITPNTEAHHSSELGQLALALSKAQGEFDIALNGKRVDVKNKEGKVLYGYNYAELPDLYKASRKQLTKYELAVTQDIITDKQSGYKYLYTILIHSSGQWIKSSILLDTEDTPGKSKNQAEGGTVTFWKRYAYASIIGIASADEEDLNMFNE